MITLDTQEKTEILVLTLKGFSDKEITKKVSFRYMLSNSSIQTLRNIGRLPKRKSVLRYPINITLRLLGLELQERGYTKVSSINFAHYINSLGVCNSMGKTWNMNSVSHYLSQYGVKIRKGQLKLADLEKVVQDYDLGEYDCDMFDPSRVLPDVTKLVLEDKVEIPANVGTNYQDKKMLKAIKTILANHNVNYNQLTIMLNEQGFTNYANKPLGRWSVMLFCTKNGVVINKTEAVELLPLVKEYMDEQDKTQSVSLVKIVQDFKTTLDPNEQYKRLKQLKDFFRPLVSEHNTNAKEYHLTQVLKPQIMAVIENQTYPIKFEALGAELGKSTMWACRMCDQLGVSPMKHYQQRMYEIISAYIIQHPTFKLKELAEHLNTTKYLTPRGHQWDYTTAYLFYNKLKDIYSNLPNSKGTK